MSGEANRHARTEMRVERERDESRTRAEERQKRVGAERREERRENPRLEREDIKGGHEGSKTYARQIHTMKQTYTAKIAKDEKKFAQERLLLKQQRQMEHMKEEIVDLREKAKELEVERIQGEREQDQKVARLTIEGAESSRQFKKEVEEEAGTVAAEEVEKKLRLDKEGYVHEGKREARREARERREKRERKKRREVDEKRQDEYRKDEYRKEQREKRDKKMFDKMEAREEDHTSQLALARAREQARADVRSNVVQAVPVKTVVAIAESVGAGEGLNGHPGKISPTINFVVIFCDKCRSDLTVEKFDQLSARRPPRSLWRRHSRMRQWRWVRPRRSCTRRKRKTHMTLAVAPTRTRTLHYTFRSPRQCARRPRVHGLCHRTSCRCSGSRCRPI